MKRHICVLVAFCMIITLAACQKEEPETDLRRESDSLLPPEPGEVAVEEDYPYGNMQKNVPSGNFMCYENDVVFLANNSTRLYTYDMETGKTSFFDRDATGRGGNALSGNLESYNGRLYALDPGSRAVEVKQGVQSPLCDGSLYGFWHSNGSLYCVTKDASLLVYEKNGKDPRMLLEEYTGIWNVVFGQYLYGNVEENIVRVNLRSEKPQEEILVKNAGGIVEGHHIYYVDYKTWYLYRCNMDGSDPILLVDKPVLLASMNFDDDYFYFRLYTDTQLEEGEDCFRLYRFPKEDPARIEEIAELPYAVFQVFTVPGYDKLFVVTLGPLNAAGNRDQWPIYVMNTDGSDVTPVELPDY